MLKLNQLNVGVLVEENEQEMENQKHRMSTNLFPSLIKSSLFFPSLTFFFFIVNYRNLIP